MTLMSGTVRVAIVSGARLGFNLVELALEFCNHKYISHEEYLAFCSWAKHNSDFYYWLRSRLNARYRIEQ